MIEVDQASSTGHATLAVDRSLRSLDSLHLTKSRPLPDLKKAGQMAEEQ